jgi:hypothetical protein
MPQPSTLPLGFRTRTHYTRTGEAKRPLTVVQARQVCADNPNLEAYVCPTCGQYHTGNRTLVRHADQGGTRR